MVETDLKRNSKYSSVLPSEDYFNNKVIHSFYLICDDIFIYL